MKLLHCVKYSKRCFLDKPGMWNIALITLCNLSCCRQNIIIKIMLKLNQPALLCIINRKTISKLYIRHPQPLCISECKKSCKKHKSRCNQACMCLRYIQLLCYLILALADYPVIYTGKLLLCYILFVFSRKLDIRKVLSRTYNISYFISFKKYLCKCLQVIINILLKYTSVLVCILCKTCKQLSYS